MPVASELGSADDEAVTAASTAGHSLAAAGGRVAEDVAPVRVDNVTVW